MLKTVIIYTEGVTSFKRMIASLFKTKFSMSLHIKNTINHEKLSMLTKLQIANINTYFNKQGLFVRVAIKGNKVWEVWYND